MDQHDSTIDKLQKPLTVREQFELMGWLLAGLWTVEIIDNLLLGGSLDNYGIRPRVPAGLLGIPLAPFLHGGFAHLTANSIPLAVLGWLTLSRGFLSFVSVSAIITAVGGFGVWLVGAENSVHIGASILIFGYLGFLLTVGLKTRTLRDVLTSVIVGAIYGSMVWGVLPGDAGISWEGHLFGFLGGVLSAHKVR